MDRKKVFLIILVIIIGLLSSLYFFNKKDDKVEEIDIKEYDTDVVCIYKETAEDEDSLSYMSNVYIDYNKGGDITYIVYQTLTLDDFGESSLKTVKDFYEIYNGLNGIKTDVYLSNNYLVTTIEYDFSKLELDVIRKEIGELLDETSFLNADKLPINYKTYIEEYLSEYKCEVK